MAKVFGTAIYAAHRVDGILHITAHGQKPYIQTKVSLEQLPFEIYPPEFGLFFDTEGLVSPAVMPFEIEKAFASFPKSRKSVRIHDAAGVHVVDIQDVFQPMAPATPTAPDAASYVVYRQINTDRYMIAKAGQIVPAIYIKVFGPDTLEKCQQYVQDHRFTGQIDLIAGTMHAWVNRFPGPDAHPKLIVTVDAFVEVDWKVSLVRAQPQGFNPAVLLLSVQVELPTGPAHSNAIARRTLRYEEDGQTAYTSVTIENGSDSMSAPVGIAE